MNEQVKKRAATLWKKGQSGNLAGRPTGSRNKFSEDVVTAFAVDWAAGGPEVIARVRQQDPSTYLRVVASILPKDVLVNVQQQVPGNLDPDEWRVLVDLVRLIKTSAPEGASALPSDIAPALETVAGLTLLSQLPIPKTHRKSTVETPRFH